MMHLLSAAGPSTQQRAPQLGNLHGCHLGWLHACRLDRLDAARLDRLPHGRLEVEDGVAQPEAAHAREEQLELIRHGDQHEQVAQEHLQHVAQRQYQRPQPWPLAQPRARLQLVASCPREALVDEPEPRARQQPDPHGAWRVEAPLLQQEDDAITHSEDEATHVHVGAWTKAILLVAANDRTHIVVQHRRHGGRRWADRVATRAMRLLVPRQTCPGIDAPRARPTRKTAGRHALHPAEDLVGPAGRLVRQKAARSTPISGDGGSRQAALDLSCAVLRVRHAVWWQQRIGRGQVHPAVP
mmetsp:Transcript_30825/g.90378  ORF Transcript_30825/g.90378 Transcript_30825/m.90378 type:complete len:298 (+) Transcript_30825:335-1228(+)